MQQGFFDLGLPNAPTPAKRGSVRSVGCDECKLCHSCESPKMEPIGEGRLKILIVGESPSPTDDEKGEYYCGNTGRPVWKAEKALGKDFLRDCWVTWALRCHPGKRTTSVQLTHCRSKLLAVIAELKPKVIILLGTDATQGLLGERLSGRIKNTLPSAFIGCAIPDRELNAWVCPTYGPYILANEKRPEALERLFQEHIAKAYSLAKVPLPKLIENVRITEDKDEAIEWIKEARNSAKEIAFDYETTGIKPHAEGHHIASASFAYGNTGYAFPFFNDLDFIVEWDRLMRTNKVGKIAHKADFEIGWTHARGGMERWVNNLTWDSCLAAHCLNNQGPTGLKFQTYVKLGVLGYDDEADQFVTKSAPGDDGSHGNNGFNCVDQAPLKTLLHYNALDSLYTLYLTAIQREFFVENPHLLAGMNFFLEAQQVIAKVQQEGMRLDESALEERWKELSLQINLLWKEMLSTPEGKRAPLGFNPDSDKQLAEFLYKTLGYDKPEGSSGGDEEALKKVGTPFTLTLLKYRKLCKMRDTYLAQFKRENVSGLIRPNFNLHKVKTFRSSSDSPNFQNIPKRDKEAQKIIRSLIPARAGNRIVEYDYKAVEVGIGACYHKDPTMISYIKDASKDMHRDMAMQLFFRTEKTFAKMERYNAKNGYVFPAFYGSTAETMAPAMWEAIGPDTMENLEKNGIKKLSQFVAHVKAIDEDFWGNRFPVYSEWKQKIWKDFQKKGYVDLYTGFRCHGPLQFTELTNAPIQGSAFHVLLWTLSQSFDPIKEISGRSSIIGQIHDAMVGDIHPEDEVEIDAIVKDVGTKKVREHWPWIIIPLTIEKEVSAVDGNWAEMSPGGVL